MDLKKLPLHLVSPSPMNPRKTFDEAELQELADNIEKQGLLQPITVRPISGTSKFSVVDGVAGFHPEYEIICGERRFRAFSRLYDKYVRIDVIDADGEPDNPFAEISAIVREMNDDEAFDAMITENLQRKDVDPMEEAFAFQQLIRKGSSPEDVAARFGKSVRFVQDRVKLNNLIPELIVAVKEDKMSISAAMIIAKLDEELQRKFHSQYQHNYNGFSKSNALTFVDRLFMTIDKSLWYKSDNQADEDFDGGCGRKCSECPLNTSNHGCLFWEMKSKDAGRCTDRAKFNSKTMAYMLREIDAVSDTLVKKNESLTFGKTVLCFTDNSYDSEDVKALKAAITPELDKRGLEIADPNQAFSHVVSYAEDDERVEEMLKSGQVYRCLKLFEWNEPVFKYCHFHVKRNDNSVNVGEDGVPLKVKNLLETLKNSETSLKSTLTVECAQVLAKGKFSTEPLVDDERVLMLSFMLVNNYKICEDIGAGATSITTDPIALRKFVAEHPDKWPQIMHGWICQQINERHPCMRMAEGVLDDLAVINGTEGYESAKNKVLTKFNKSKAKITKQLQELGYGLDGKPLVINESTGDDVFKAIEKVKAKNPDAIVLVKSDAGYSIFGDDAEVAAPILGLNIVPWYKDPKVNICGFIPTALDKKLPLLIKSGKRVAIIENIEATK